MSRSSGYGHMRDIEMHCRYSVGLPAALLLFTETTLTQQNPPIAGTRALHFGTLSNFAGNFVLSQPTMVASHRRVQDARLRGLSWHKTCQITHQFTAPQDSIHSTGLAAPSGLCQSSATTLGVSFL